MDKNSVILVDENDQAIGVMEKMEAHKSASLHRAVSIFIINSKGEWLLQRRALNKYHSAGLWTNACCTHPHPGEENPDAAARRLVEEMGIVCEIKEIFSFIYKEKLDNDLTEHEFDHVFIGKYDGNPDINTEEVVNWKSIDYKALHHDINQQPDRYTYWFKKIYKKVEPYLKSTV